MSRRVACRLLVGPLLFGLCTLSGCQGSYFRTAFNRWSGPDYAAYGDHSDPQFVASSGYLRNSEVPNPFQTASASADANALSKTLQNAQVADARKDYRLAKLGYQKALTLQPTNAIAHHRLAVIADKEQDYQTAERHYLLAIQHTPNNPDLLSDLGYSYLLQKRYAESEPYLKRTMQLSPGHKTAANNLGVLYARQDRYDESLAMFLQGGSETEAQRKLDELFPGGRPQVTPNSGPSMEEIAESNTPSVETMRLKAMMDQARSVSLAEKQQAEVSAPDPTRQPLTPAGYERTVNGPGQGTGAVTPPSYPRAPQQFPSRPATDPTRTMQQRIHALDRMERQPPKPHPSQRPTSPADVDPRSSMPLWNPNGGSTQGTANDPFGSSNPSGQQMPPQGPTAHAPTGGSFTPAPVYSGNGSTQMMNRQPNGYGNPGMNASQVQPVGHDAPQGNAGWNGQQNVRSAHFQTDANRRHFATQVGMNAGPGVVFPTGMENRPAANNAPAWNGVPSVNSPGANPQRMQGTNGFPTPNGSGYGTGAAAAPQTPQSATWHRGSAGTAGDPNAHLYRGPEAQNYRFNGQATPNPNGYGMGTPGYPSMPTAPPSNGSPNMGQPSPNASAWPSGPATGSQGMTGQPPAMNGLGQTQPFGNATGPDNPTGTVTRGWAGGNARGYR